MSTSKRLSAPEVGGDWPSAAKGIMSDAMLSRLDRVRSRPLKWKVRLGLRVFFVMVGRVDDGEGEVVL